MQADTMAPGATHEAKGTSGAPVVGAGAQAVVTTAEPSILDSYGGYRPGLARIELTGANQRPRRFIHAPRLEWAPVPGATSYRVVAWSGRQRFCDRTVDRSSIELAAEWDGARVGPCRLVIVALDAAGAPNGVSTMIGFHKAPGWPGEISPPRFTYAETATQIMRWLASDVAGRGVYDPSVPPYFWHAVIRPEDNSVHNNNRAFPALHNGKGVQAFIAYAAHGEDAALREEAMKRARGLADFTIAHSTPAHHKFAHLPYHTISQGKVGLHGGHRPDLEDIAEPNKTGLMGIAYLDLYEATGETTYRDAARRIADTLAATQKEDGSWDYRVNSVTGYSEETYTSAGSLALTLLDRIREHAPDAKYQGAYEGILSWMLDNPVRTGRWENSFDDTRYAEPYANPAPHDALYMGRFLLDHATDDPRFLELALGVFRWIDDNFVLYTGDDPRVPYRPHTPSVTEQWTFYWPMNSHTSNWLLFLIKLWEQTGDDSYRQRALGAANVLTQCQLTDGRSSTWVPDVDTGVGGVRRDWYGCMFMPVTALLEAATKLL